MRGRVLALPVIGLAAAGCGRGISLDAHPLEAPARVSAQAIPGGVRVEWSAVPSADEYLVSTWIGDALFQNYKSDDVSPLELTGYLSGTTYRVEVRARSRGRASPASADLLYDPRPDDYLARTAALQLDGPEAGANFGAALTAGDANGDGIDDLLVGSPGSSVSAPGGAVALYLGSVAGLGSAVWTSSESFPNARLGQYVQLHDIDLDGRAEVIASAPDNGASAGGDFRVWYSSLSGPEPVPLVVTGTGAGSHLGAGLAVGDFGEDGFPDIAVGDLLGGAIRIAPGPYPDLSGPVLPMGGGDPLGFRLAADDVNADGIADLLAGAPSFDSGPVQDTGAAALFLGGQGGPDLVADGTVEGDALQDAQFGFAIAAGDVDGDGSSDVLVGAPGVANFAGRVYAYATSAGTLAATPAWNHSGGDPNTDLGCSIAVLGDFDGDGASEFAVGMRGGSRVRPFNGGSPPTLAGWEWTGNGADLFGTALAAGDFDGNGVPDLAVGAPLDAGRVDVFPGVPRHGPRVDAGLPIVGEAGAKISPAEPSFGDTVLRRGYTCTWSWGDGTPDEEIPECTPESAASASHIWAEAGRYVVRLRVDADDLRFGEAATVARISR